MNHKILIIDDDDDYRRLLVRFLERYDFQVQVAGDLDSAVEAAVGMHPDVIIVDFRFKNNVTGFDILDALKKNDIEARTIFVSGYASWELEERMEQHGVFRFLPKPFELEELLEVVQQAAAEAGAEN